ncbi:DEAD/DEAH box helicase [Novosphingobium sp. MMS21-SN21R]|uniref:DEAD/DEAH box helicase n=1 Tax=Novosphingobium sp. MMS21-SN21R TaxID=2969298 RepID=UPI002884FE34|nr:DEAD/DEAH box helicase [Novosphingobium sp. MMS21-SN21R]MDT0506922.1 DEAD/DEAH box helicase [Novosphingobium sp. MMS21-SN21R]
MRAASAAINEPNTPPQKRSSSMNAFELLTSSTPAAIVDRHDIPPRAERLAKWPEAYRDERFVDWRKGLARGNEHLWMHQSEALAMLNSAKNIVMATGTGSGKSLVFQADTLLRLVTKPDATILALYPAKALVSDQMKRWREALGHAGIDAAIAAEVQGDIPPADRDELLKRARVIVATEDVVHAWLMRTQAAPAAQRFIRNLELVIIDEAHNLEGVFGSNCAFLFRRLRAARSRTLTEAGLPHSEMQFIAASATIANPAAHLERLTGLPFEVIGEEHNGAPCDAKTLLHIEGPEYGAAAEANLADLVARIAGQIAPNALIAFADGRQSVERVATTIGSDEVEPFRAGFELQDRSAITAGMRDGTLRAIVATSSLELGIDVPQFNLGLNLGLPMSKKAFQQRVGRIGRAGPGVFAVIAEPSAFAKLGTTLREFYEGAPETSPLYLENSIIQYQNACCFLEEAGGAERQPALPSGIAWPEGFDRAFAMAKPGAIRPREIEHVANCHTGSPQIDFPLRRIGDGRLGLRIHGAGGDLLGTIDDAKALREACPGSTYYHRKKLYKVVEWRTTAYERSIYLRPMRAAPRTSAIMRTAIGVSHASSELQEGRLLQGTHGSLAEVRLQVTESVEGYRSGKVDLLYRELSKKDRRLSRKTRNFSTTGILIRIDEPWFRGRNGAPADLRDQVGRALAAVLFRECGIGPGEVRWEHSGISMYGLGSAQLLDDALVIFDDLPGGLRLTAPLFAELDHFLERLRRGAELAGEEALLDEITVTRLMNWSDSLSITSPGSAETLDLHGGQRLIYAPHSKVSVRIRGNIVERELLHHQLLEVGGAKHLVYSYEAGPGVTGVVFHDQIEPIGHEWRQLIWDEETDTVEEIAA